MDTLFFVTAKLVGLVLKLDYWLLALGLLTLLALWRGRLRGARTWGTLWMALFLSLGLLPLGDWIMGRLEAPYPPRLAPEVVHGIVILGGVEDQGAGLRWGGAQLNASAERLTVGAALARAHPDARVVFTGGSGRLRDLAASDAHADIGAVFLRDAGISGPRLIIERVSRNTTENARLSLPLASPQPGETWVLVTSAAHMPRALRSFVNAGWPEMTPLPVDHRSHHPRLLEWRLERNLDLLGFGLRESVGRLAYSVLGR